MGLFENLNIYCDIASNHHGDKQIFANLFLEVQQAGAIPKIQLYSPETFPHKWAEILPANQFVPSVFRPADVDFIMPFQPLALKVASVEATYRELILRCLKEDLPLIVSTGGMDDEELFQLIDTVQDHRAGVTLMHCVSLYPTALKDLNLGRLTSLAEAIEDADIELGFSSHYAFVNPKVTAMAYSWGVTQWEVHVRDVLHTKGTLDENCALTVNEIRELRNQIEDCIIIEGSDEIVGPDRDFVVAHRKRWQGKQV